MYGVWSVRVFRGLAARRGEGSKGVDLANRGVNLAVMVKCVNGDVDDGGFGR